MVIMAGAVFFCIRLALAAIPAIALRYPIKKWAAAGAMIGAFGYLMISGAAFRHRALLHHDLHHVPAVLLDRPAVALRNVALAALAILVVWPESLFDPGSRCRSPRWWRWSRPTSGCAGAPRSAPQLRCAERCASA
jgi:competence protein ComEC